MNTLIKDLRQVLDEMPNSHKNVSFLYEDQIAKIRQLLNKAEKKSDRETNALGDLEALRAICDQVGTRGAYSRVPILNRATDIIQSMKIQLEHKRKIDDLKNHLVDEAVEWAGKDITAHQPLGIPTKVFYKATELIEYGYKKGQL